jgi:hypothetical protein
MMDLIIFYLTIFWAFRFGQILALNQTIRVWHLLSVYMIYKFIIMSYGY